MFADEDEDENLKIQLDNDSKFTKRPRDMSEADRTGNEIWGGAFWELRGRIGDGLVTDKLLASAWTSWQPARKGSLSVEFVQKLIDADRTQHDGQHVTDIQETFKGRGLKV